MPNIDKSHFECDRMRKAEVVVKPSSEVFLHKWLERIRGRSTCGDLKAEALAILSDKDPKPATTQMLSLILYTGEAFKGLLARKSESSIATGKITQKKIA